ncbi:UDP-N-acetylglucosamine 1-carboxyvinyltransferase [Candidatus Dependentiae bacterium]|nr:UDP-N-acetylglucosamine 1-carboxyvinyltransferase [Candidatus Dependentiae bacterium]
MSNEYILVKQSKPLYGTVKASGAKNAALPIMAALILNSGKNVLKNIPNSTDVKQMIKLLEDLGAKIFFDTKNNYLEVDTSEINNFEVKSEIMNKMRASILVMGSLLARFNKAKVAMPGGCLIGARPIDFHLKGFLKMGVNVKEQIPFFDVTFMNKGVVNNKIILEYPSVGATENLAMFACLKKGRTIIINAALEPEVLDFLDVLKKMGAQINIKLPATIEIIGVEKLNSVEHEIIPDRLEVGTLLLACAVCKGEIHVENAQSEQMDVFLEKLKEMGHEVECNDGIKLKATDLPVAVGFKTGPHPGFPTDLQAPMLVAQCVANGRSIIEETVFENRLMHTIELQKMGAQIKIYGNKAQVNGVEYLYGTEVIATDIRASAALVISGLVAKGETKILGIHHWKRGYDKLEEKLKKLGANISF